ncbi:hypothetical protein DPMN_145686 [Dreissena polymorpha]|uniref:Uncharacterized protein n=1 Tax=Dreissena polymorpha TaxID=45954 RepID=A0A9D4F914_DREPO|nr:hypothetical protein DPMN_145686 [Dreissena polymorpha]
MLLEKTGVYGGNRCVRRKPVCTEKTGVYGGNPHFQYRDHLPNAHAPETGIEPGSQK